MGTGLHHRYRDSLACSPDCLATILVDSLRAEAMPVSDI